jgi:capsular exopolysaccharide synthesis family protein
MTGRKVVPMHEKTQTIIKYAPSELSYDVPRRPHERSLTQQQLTATDLWNILAKRKLTILGFAAIVFAFAAAYTYTRTPVYEATARLQIDPSRSTNLGLDDGEAIPGGSYDVDSHIKTEMAIIESETVAMRVMNALKLYANPGFAGESIARRGITGTSELTPSERQQLLSTYESNLNIKVAPNTEVVEVQFRNPDPILATRIANSVVDEYMERNFLERVNGTADVSLWLSKQLDEIKSSTAASQQKLADFQRDHNFLGVDESDNIVTNRLKQLNEELTQAEADRIIKEGRYRLAEAGNPELIDSTLSNTTLQTLQTQHADLQARYSQLSAKYGEGYPALRELQQQMAQLNGQINAEGINVKTRLANEFHAAAETEDMIGKEFGEQKEQAHKLNEHVTEYQILKHEVEAGQQLYDTLQLKLKTAGITSGLASSIIDVIDRAQVPDSPVEPRKGLNLMLGLASGLLGGILLGLVQDSFDDTIRTSEELEAVTALPELACVPFVDALAGAKNEALKGPHSPIPLRSTFTPIALRDPTSPSAESYQALCSFVLLSSLRNSTKTLVITSATPGEGKSTVSCNLATSLAQRGRKVLLVDADLRCSSIHSQLGIGLGLSTICLTDSANYLRYQPIANLPTLHAIPAGIPPADPTGVLDSARMHELMAIWRTEYDHIIIDTPPALPFADAWVLAAQADGVILVARSGMSRSKALLRVRDLLTRSGVNILGVVMNAARHREYYYEFPPGYRQASERNGQKLPAQ